MPRRNMHIKAGLLAGGMTAWTLASHRGLSGIDVFFETLGGAIGGQVGALLPDLIDKPVSPNHRGVAHAIVPNVLGSDYSINWILSLQKYFRKLARYYAYLISIKGKSAPFEWQFYRVFYSLAAGALPGIISGLVSHLLLDSTTPKGLPVIGIRR